jgi:hypothetical protein
MSHREENYAAQSFPFTLCPKTLVLYTRIGIEGESN